MARIGYIRTSTDRQSHARQIDGLRGQVDQIFIEDGVSASGRSRPVFDKAMASLKPGDTFVVWSLDRAFRSVIDALRELDRLSAAGIGFRSLTQAFDTSTPEGRLQFTLIAALAEWEREIIRKRTCEGLEAARRRGVKLGRPRKDAAQKKHPIDA